MSGGAWAASVSNSAIHFFEQQYKSALSELAEAMDAAGLVEACRLGDRASCDALEFEGIAAAPSRRGPGSWLGSRFVPSGGSTAAAYWHPNSAELAFAVLPLLLLGIATWLLGLRPGRRRGASSGANGAATLDHTRARRAELAQLLVRPFPASSCAWFAAETLRAHSIA